MTTIRWSGRAPRIRSRGPRTRAARPGVLPLESRIVPTHVFTVNSFTDGVVANPGAGTALTSDGRITLRSAIMEDNAEGGGGVILPAGSYTLSLTGANEDAGATGDLDILTPIFVQGAGSGSVTIHGDGSDRLFDIRTNVDINISGLTLTGGNADVGGALRSVGGSRLTLTDMVIEGNTATSNGGAIAGIAPGPHGQITLDNVLIQNNTAGGFGGGIYMDGQTVIASGLTIAGNNSKAGGGGAAIVDTQATNFAGAQVSNTTISGNVTTGHGGGVMIQAGIVQATDTTVTLNQAALGGGIENGATLGGGNNIVAGNIAPTSPDIFGQYNSQGFNLIGDGSGATGTMMSSDLIGTASAPIDPLLSPLVIHGGTLPVQIPLPGSPALNVGQSFAPSDERGVTRPTSGSDIGAVEARAFAITSSGGGQHAAGGTAFGPLTAIVTEGGQALPGAAVTFTAPASGPSGTFGDTPIVHTDASGRATAPTFTANFTPGSYAVRASVTASLFSDIPLSNDRALVDSLVVTLGPGPYQVGQPFQLTVTAFTPGGVRDANYAGTVSFSTDSAAQATLPPPTTFGSTDAGQKTFQVLFGGLGTHVIKVTDPNGPAGQVSVTVTPVTNRFVISAPPTVVEGTAFTITITAQDSHGNPLPSFVGPVTLTSDDPRAVLPTNIVFTAADNGVKKISGLSLRPPGPHTITATATDGTVGSVSVGVTNLGPTGLVLQTDHPSIQEGGTLTLSGSFTNPDPQDTHTVDIKWGDGGHTDQPLGAGVFQFQITHQYATPSPTGTAGFPISVTVTDAAGGSTAGNANVFVSNVPPQLPPSGGGATGDAGQPFGQIIPFNDPGTDNWTAVADYGDGTGNQPVPVSGHTLDLNHVYAAEGTFTVHVTLSDGNGGTATLTETAAVFPPGTTGIQVITVPPGGTATLTIPGAVITLSNLGGTTTAVLLAGDVNPAVLKGLTGSPSADPTQLVTAYDIRVLTAGPDSVLTAQLTYPNGAPAADPSVQFYDKTGAHFVAVTGSTKVSNSFVVDKAAHTATFILGDTSTPKVSDLGGTVFTLSVPAPTISPTSSSSSSVNAGTSPFLLASAAPASSALAALDVGTSINAPIPTTGLVSSSTLTVAVSAAEGLVRGGGDEPLTGRLVNPQTLSTVIEAAVEISDFLKETFQMWLDQPLPMEAPAAILPPPDTIDQIQLRSVHADVAALQKQVAAAPPAPVAFDALSVPPAKDAIVAQAESRPWWLTAAPQRSEITAGDEAIPVEPTTADRAAAAVTAVWLGGSALAAVLPEPRLDDDEEKWPLAQPEEQDDE
jgi:predicted outer membrane repeat protein